MQIPGRCFPDCGAMFFDMLRLDIDIQMGGPKGKAWQEMTNYFCKYHDTLPGPMFECLLSLSAIQGKDIKHMAEHLSKTNSETLDEVGALRKEVEKQAPLAAPSAARPAVRRTVTPLPHPLPHPLPRARSSATDDGPQNTC